MKGSERMVQRSTTKPKTGQRTFSFSLTKSADCVVIAEVGDGLGYPDNSACAATGEVSSLDVLAVGTIGLYAASPVRTPFLCVVESPSGMKSRCVDIDPCGTELGPSPTRLDSISLKALAVS